MARSHARIHVAIWRNEGWLTLTPKAKLLYLTLLSQPRLSLVGSLDLSVGRWAAQTGMERGHVDAALAELQEGRYVVTDPLTDELLIRTFVAHDLDSNRWNANLSKGFWGRWGAISSALLRSVVVHETPDALWVKLEPHAPTTVYKPAGQPG